MKPDTSQDSLVERCRRICGGSGKECIIDTPARMACIADMVINKTFGMSLMLRHALGARDHGEIRQYIDLALISANELTNWVRYLQLARDLRDLLDLEAAPGRDKRREMRYPLPEGLRRFIALRTEHAGEVLEMELLNFSQSGFQALAPRGFRHDELLACTLTTLQRADRQVGLSARVKYCDPAGERGHLIGAAIEDVSDSADFNFFNDVFSLIMELGAQGISGNP